MRPKDDELFSGASGQLHPSDIYVDAEGDWYNAGVKLFREEIIRLFLENLHRDENGAFYIEWENSRCSILAEDTPYVIGRVDFSRCGDSSEEILVKIRYLDSQLQLDPESLYVGGNDVLYGSVGTQRLPARFSRPAYYQLAERIQEDEENDEFCIVLSDRRYRIKKGLG